jgi:hypothetical protein
MPPGLPPRHTVSAPLNRSHASLPETHKVPLAEDVTFEGPLVPKLTGRQTIKGFLASILPMVNGIQLKQHIVEGDYVATVFDMETVNGVDHVFDWIQIVDGEIKAIQ